MNVVHNSIYFDSDGSSQNIEKAAIAERRAKILKNEMFLYHFLKSVAPKKALGKFNHFIQLISFNSQLFMNGLLLFCF